MRKRFIAGASCPLCKQSDSLRVWEENQIEIVECVECDYLEHKVEEKSAKSLDQSGHDTQNLIGIFKPD